MSRLCFLLLAVLVVPSSLSAQDAPHPERRPWPEEHPIKAWIGTSLSTRDLSSLGELTIQSGSRSVSLVTALPSQFMAFANDGDQHRSMTALTLGLAHTKPAFHASVSGGIGMIRTRHFRQNGDDCFLFCSGEWVSDGSEVALMVKAEASVQLLFVSIGIQAWAAGGGNQSLYGIGPAFRLGRLW